MIVVDGGAKAIDGASRQLARVVELDDDAHVDADVGQNAHLRRRRHGREAERRVARRRAARARRPSVDRANQQTSQREPFHSRNQIARARNQGDCARVARKTRAISKKKRDTPPAPGGMLSSEKELAILNMLCKCCVSLYVV